jgi:hypothetical protein
MIWSNKPKVRHARSRGQLTIKGRWFSMEGDSDSVLEAYRLRLLTLVVLTLASLLAGRLAWIVTRLL